MSDTLQSLQISQSLKTSSQKHFFLHVLLQVKSSSRGKLFYPAFFSFFSPFSCRFQSRKGTYHHPPVSCTTIYKLLKTYRLHNAISVRYTEPKNRLKKCEILSICRKIRLFEDVFYFSFWLFSLIFAQFSCLLFYGKESKKTRAMLLHIALAGMKRGFLFSFFFLFFSFLFRIVFFALSE